MKLQHILAGADGHVAVSAQAEFLEPEGLSHTLYGGHITLR